VSSHSHDDRAPDPRRPPAKTQGVSRRSFIQTMGISAAAGSVGARLEAAAAQPAAPEAPIFGPDPAPLTLTVNGNALRATVDPATTLLDALRLHFNLTGSKEICDRGSCGGCSVLVNGRLVNSCMMLAVDAVGANVETVEGLERNGKLHVLQESFVRHDALQCGYCTPGLLMACKALIDANPQPSLDDIKQGLSGNICRCGAYTNVFNAVLEATGQPAVVDKEV
jgi:xanthine dehydrogenase YagT iron-sulfur-binding subunit